MKNIFNKRLKASVTVFVLLMLGFIIGMYLIGYKSPAVTLGEQIMGGGNADSGIKIDALLGDLKDVILSPFGGVTLLMIFFSSIVGTAVSGFANQFSNKGGTGNSNLSGTILTFFIPLLILFAVANVFFFPTTQMITHPDDSNGDAPSPMPFEANLLLAIVFNVLLMLTVLSWITGRD